MPQRFGPGLHGAPLLETVDIGQKSLGIGIAGGGIGVHGLGSDGAERRRRGYWKHEPQQRAQRIDVGAMIEAGVGSAKSGRSSDRVDAPIHNVHLAELTDHNVLWL